MSPRRKKPPTDGHPVNETVRPRKVFVRQADPAVLERDRKMEERAREWVRDEAIAMFHRLKEEMPDTDGLTASEVMKELDLADFDRIPPGYVRYLDSNEVTYRKRYNLVKNELDALERAHILGWGKTMNAKHREAKCYFLAPPGPKFDIQFDGHLDHSFVKQLETMFTDYARENPGFRGLIVMPRGSGLDKKSSNRGVTREVKPKITQGSHHRAGTRSSRPSRPIPGGGDTEGPEGELTERFEAIPIPSEHHREGGPSGASPS